MSVAVSPRIFREYDVRGVVGEDLTEVVVEELGKSFGTYAASLGHQRISLGYDMRLSSVPFAEAISRGVLSTGIDVVEIGEVPTPLLYYSLFNLDVDGGIMITGSHNPSEFNGFKLALGHATIYGEEIQKVRRILESGQYATGRGVLSKADVFPHYAKEIKERIGPFSRRLKVVVDAGNGMGGAFGPAILRDLGAEVIELFTEPDGTFPNHHPDPTVPENMESLRDTVLSERADLGVGYDGDADRLGVIDDTGKILWGDQLLILFSREVLRSHPGASIIFEVKCSQLLVDDVTKHGGNPIMWRTGHSLI
jgi:phosphomannomutase/phosphoglucomutase